MFLLKNIERFTLDFKQINKLTSLYAKRGQETYFAEFFKKFKQALIPGLVSENTYYFSLMFSELDRDKLKKFTSNDYKPNNLKEKFVQNSRKIISSIQQTAEKGLHNSDIYAYASALGDGIHAVSLNRAQSNQTSFLDASGKPLGIEAKLSEVCTLYNTLCVKEIEKVTLISNFLIDYYMLEPYLLNQKALFCLLAFRLLTAEFKVFSYVSFFKFLTPLSTQLDQALAVASTNWLHGHSDTSLLFEILTSVCFQAYQEFETKAHQHQFEATINRKNDIIGQIRKFQDTFTVADLKKANPHISLSTINRTLKTLKDSGEIILVGKGKSSFWQKTHTTTNLLQSSFFTQD